MRFALFDERADFLIHRIAGARAGINRKADGRAAEAQRVFDGARQSGTWFHFRQRVGVVELQDERNLAGEFAADGLEKAERRGVRVTAGFDGELDVIVGIVRGRIRRKRPGRSVLEALVDGKDDHLAGAAELAGVEQPSQIGEGAGIVGWVPGQNLTNALGRFMPA